MQQVLLSLGANLGERFSQLESAVQHICSRMLVDARVSSVVESPPLGYTSQPQFLNCCVYGHTYLSDEQLHIALRELESDLGRLQRPQWHEREIDIDIVLMDGVQHGASGLQIPHPRMHERRFVLQPAAEIAPNMVHQIFQLSVEELLLNCDDTSRLSLFSQSIYL